MTAQKLQALSCNIQLERKSSYCCIIITTLTETEWLFIFSSTYILHLWIDTSIRLISGLRHRQMIALTWGTGPENLTFRASEILRKRWDMQKNGKNSWKLAHFIFQFSWINQSWFNREEPCSQIDISGEDVQCRIPFCAQATSQMIKPLSDAVGPFHHSGNINAIFRVFSSQEVQFPPHSSENLHLARNQGGGFCVVWSTVVWTEARLSPRPHRSGTRLWSDGFSFHFILY